MFYQIEEIFKLKMGIFVFAKTERK